MGRIIQKTLCYWC